MKQYKPWAVHIVIYSIMVADMMCIASLCVGFESYINEHAT